jgi:hypothetical protein
MLMGGKKMIKDSVVYKNTSPYIKEFVHVFLSDIVILVVLYSMFFSL